MKQSEREAPGQMKQSEREALRALLNGVGS